MTGKRLIAWFVPFGIGALIASIGLFVGVHAVHAQGSSNCADSNTTAPATLVENCNGHPGVYGIEMRVINAQIVAHPNPGLTPLPTDDKMLYQRAYRKVLKATDVYNAPGGGGVISHLDGGFNFVNAGQLQNGFVEIRPGQWVPNDVLGPVNKAVSHFSGVTLSNGMPSVGFGWILDDDTKVSLWPGAKPLPNTPIIHRYTMVNFFATVDVDGWEWYMIGPRQWIIQKHVAYPHLTKRPDGVSGKWFAVDLFEQTLIAYEDDKPIFTTMISSGLPKFKTDEGLFKILSRYQEVKMSGASGQPDFYYLPQVPFVQYFNQDEQALHGAYWHDYFGWPRSHGCVNMSLTDAQWAFNWTKDAPQAFVYVYHSHDPKAGTGSLK